MRCGENMRSRSGSGGSPASAARSACFPRIHASTFGSLWKGLPRPSVAPLIVASGAGAVSRFNIGLVIAAGLTIGTLFTLFVVPAVYMLIAGDHHTAHEEKPEPEIPHPAIV